MELQSLIHCVETMRKKYFICLILLVAVILLNLPLPVSLRIKAGSRDNLAPFQNVMRFLMSKARDAVTFLTVARDAVEENQKALEEVARLRHQVWNLQVMRQDNEDLRKQLGFKSRQKSRLIMCEVVARGDTSGWWQTVRLNKGTEDGVGPNMAVITIGGLIGRTKKEVSRHTCDVLLITDPTCKVACKFLRAGAFGIVSGKGVTIKGDRKLEMLYAVQPCRMDYISRNFEIFENDEVVTSGLGGVYPEGLLVGHVVKTGADQLELYQRADIVPAAETRAVRYVFVVESGSNLNIEHRTLNIEHRRRE